MEYSLKFITPGVAAGVCSDSRYLPDVVKPVQTHSCNIMVIGSAAVIPDLNEADAVISLAKGLRIGVRTADCVPVLVYAPDLPAVAAIHAGWRGSIAGIVAATLQRLRDMGADPAKAEAVFGPCICGRCYEVSPDMIQEFRNAGYEEAIVGERHLDLESVNTRQIIKGGILPKRIHKIGCCTFENPGFPSWRRAPGDLRLLTWISLVPDQDVISQIPDAK